MLSPFVLKRSDLVTYSPPLQSQTPVSIADKLKVNITLHMGSESLRFSRSGGCRDSMVHVKFLKTEPTPTLTIGAMHNNYHPF